MRVLTFATIFGLRKGLTFKMDQSHVKKFMPKLLKQIESGKLNPELIITHTMRLKNAVEGYKIFDKEEQDSRKAVLTP